MSINATIRDHLCYVTNCWTSHFYKIVFIDFISDPSRHDARATSGSLHSRSSNGNATTFNAASQGNILIITSRTFANARIYSTAEYAVSSCPAGRFTTANQRFSRIVHNDCLSSREKSSSVNWLSRSLLNYKPPS